MLTPFEKWAKGFRDKPAYTYQRIGKKKPPVHEILAQFHGIKLARPDVETLQRNVLFACYQAKFCRDPNTDAAAKQRQASIDSQKELPTHYKEVRSVLAYAREPRASCARERTLEGKSDPFRFFSLRREVLVAGMVR